MINPFKKKKELTQGQKKLIEDFEEGRVLQIDNGKDNKKIFEKKK